MVKRNILYNQAKTIWVLLGNDPKVLSVLYKTSTSEFWRSSIQKYNETLRLRADAYNKAAIVANQQNKTIKPFNIKTKASTWENLEKRLSRTLSFLADIRGERKLIPQAFRRDTQRIANINRAIDEFKTEIRESKNGDRRVIFSHRIPQEIAPLVNDENMALINRLLLRTAKIHKREILNQSVKFTISYLNEAGVNLSRDGSYKHNLTNLNNFVDAFMDSVITRMINQYDENFTLRDIKITIFQPYEEPSEEKMRGSSVRSIPQANSKWLAISPKSYFNCLFQAVATCRNFSNDERYLHSDKISQSIRVNSGKELKRAVRAKFDIPDNFSDNNTIQAVCDFTRTPIKLFNNVFENISPKVYLCKIDGVRVWRYLHEVKNQLFKDGEAITEFMFKPANPMKRIKSIIKEYHIQRKNNHCIALIEKNNIKKIFKKFDTERHSVGEQAFNDYMVEFKCRTPEEIYDEDKIYNNLEDVEYENLEEYKKMRYVLKSKNEHRLYAEEFQKVKFSEDDETMKGGPIKNKNLAHSHNWNIGAWDIETTLDKNNKHTPYACSLAWNNYTRKSPETESEKAFLKDTWDIQFNKYHYKKIFRCNDKRYNGKSYGYLVENEPAFCAAFIATKKPDNRKKAAAVIFKALMVKPIVAAEKQEKQFWGLDCLQQMTKFLSDNEEIFSGITLYAHNGGKYDLPLAVEKAFLKTEYFKIQGNKCIELNNSWIGFSLQSRNSRKFRINFRDSMVLLTGSLEKLCKDLKVEHQKLPETITHSQISLINYNNNNAALKKYLSHDVIGLLEVIESFGRSVSKDLKIDITQCMTGASLSKKNFFKNYYDMKNYPVYTLKKEHDGFIRKTYFGGRVECFKIGEIVGKSYYMDFTSLYPDVGRKDLPYGEPIEYNIKKVSEKKANLLNSINRLNLDNPTYYTYENEIQKLPKDFFGWVKVLVKTKDKKAIPKHSVLKDNRLIFPIFDDWVETTIFSEELDYDIYEYKYLKMLKFKKAPILKKFFEDGFSKKAKAKANGDLAMAQAHKIIINSGYGFWGLKTKNRDGVVIEDINSNEYLDYLKCDRLLGTREYGDYRISRVLKNLNVKNFNVGISAAISSYARSKLHSLLVDIKGVGGSLYYCDTDSIISNINIKDYPDIQRKFQWDGDGSELGSLKNECDEIVEKQLKKLYPDKQLRKKCMDEMVESENGNLHFDKVVVSGCKQYSLFKDYEMDGKAYNAEIVKLKGYSQKAQESIRYTFEDLLKNNVKPQVLKSQKLKYDDMRNIGLGHSISQSQRQFKAPKSNYISETRAFNINTKYITKKFKMVYSKGIIAENGDITPLEINNNIIDFKNKRQ